MIEWILRESEKQPSRLFYEKELRARDASEFARLRHEKLLVSVQPDDRSETYGLGQQEPLTVVKIDGELYGIDDEDPEKDPVPLRRADLARYRFSLERFIDKLRAANNLLGPVSPLDRRLFFTGERVVDGKRVAFVFALLDSEKRAVDLLLSLPNRVSTNHDRIAVVTPSFTVKSEAVRAQLEKLGIHVVLIGDVTNPHVDVSALLAEAPRRKPTITLTPQQEEEFVQRGYRSRLPIFITGDTEKRATNVLEIDGIRVPVNDAPFGIFLALVVALSKNKEGSVSKAGLRSRGLVKFGGEDQAINRLRQAFSTVLGELKPEEFIEAHEAGKLRLSTHPAYVRYDKDKLLRHRNERIRKLAGLLP